MIGTRIFKAALLLAVLSLPAFPQAASINGQIIGTVFDAAGATIAGAKVTVTNVGTGYTQATETESSGLFRFTVLPLGRYDLRVEVSGFAPLKQTGIDVTAGATVTQDVKLDVKGVTTEVVVSASTAVRDPSRTDTGRSLPTYVL